MQHVTERHEYEGTESQLARKIPIGYVNLDSKMWGGVSEEEI